jgi:hypothetical protein
VLQVHGDMDAVITYGGNLFYPGAVETVTDWSRLDGCDAGTLTSTGAAVDLVPNLAGAETRREGFLGCPSGIAVELWTIQNGSHIPLFDDKWGAALYDWLLAHPNARRRFARSMPDSRLAAERLPLDAFIKRSRYVRWNCASTICRASV